jgi:hypothetical protein
MLRPPLTATKPQQLTFAPLAWLKLQYFCHAGNTEIGGFGISAASDLLYITEFVTVPQEVTLASVRFRDDGVADYFDRCVDRGLLPEQFARTWLHSHPAQSVQPSLIDEETFGRVFGCSDWAIMFILGRTGRTFARLTANAGPGASINLRCTVDWAAWPTQIALINWTAVVGDWEREFLTNIREDRRLVTGRRVLGVQPSVGWSVPAFLDEGSETTIGGHLHGFELS